ncbi:class I SAM-dependent methyltransferase [Gordonia insulae]|uniref:class I SAM-dependent methyltransferase n=1 Tax=Gordonia insulae TaxID=2420509 RepID=UPI000F5B8F6F|nr:class I SAM-dependent methyltransferase [Gordonia insulae]
MADWDGTRYGVVSDLQRTMAAESLALLRLDGTEQVLDVGCGDGYVTAQIADQLPHGAIVGIDPSPRMIEAARQRATAATFEIGDVVTLDVTDAVDVVTSFNALHWVHDQATAYRNIASALRPGGRALVVFVCEGPRRSVEQVAMDVTRDDRWADAFGDFAAPFVHPDPDTFDTLVVDAGFEIAERTVVDKTWDFGSRDAFAQWCTVGFGDWTGHLPDAAAHDFVEAVVDRYTEIVGRVGVFAFYQLRAELTRPR